MTEITLHYNPAINQWSVWLGPYDGDGFLALGTLDEIRDAVWAATRVLQAAATAMR